MTIEKYAYDKPATWSHCGWLGIPLRARCPECNKTYQDVYNGKA